ncbi:MAG: hypothetical protein V3V01_05845 [Acidimicrobiales bacterium]
MTKILQPMKSVFASPADLTLHNGGSSGLGSFIWEFEVLTEGIFAGNSPELLVSIFGSTDYDDQQLQAYPDSIVEGVGDAVLSRAPGEVIFISNGNSAQIGTLAAFDSDQQSEASLAVEDLGRLVADRI